MNLSGLDNAIRQHAGQFVCVRINDERKTKTVQFNHVVTPPVESVKIPAAGRLRDVYEIFGSILFYYDEKSGDAGKYLAPRSEWADLHGYFSGWIDSLEEDERSELLPDWIDSCLVIGETPHSGNYILMPTSGPNSGRVFEFDHDGFEFTEAAKDLVEYIKRLLNPDSSLLIEIASHMRFVDDDPMIQWWISELRDNRGHVVKTEA